MEIKWTDTDPETNERRFYAAEKFAGRWTFRYKFARREEWKRTSEPTREMWQFLHDALVARYQRREGVSDADLEHVQRILRDWRDPPSMDEETT